MKIQVLASATAFPDKIVYNKDLTQFPEEYIEIIEEKIGIKSRMHCNPDESLSDLAAKVGKKCIAKANLKFEDIDGLILGTGTADRLSPASANLVQHKIGLPTSTFAFDMNTTCPNGIYSLEIGRAMLAGSSRKNILVINAEAISKMMDPNAFASFPYFGDGAAAVILTKDSPLDLPELYEAVLMSDGSGFEFITTRGGGSDLPAGRYCTDENREEFFFSMDGRAVFEFATSRPPALIEKYLADRKISKSNVDAYILHQANTHIIAKIREVLGEPESKFPENIFKYGNTAGASTLITLAEYLETAKPKKDDYTVICGFGGGLAWGTTVLKH